MTRDFQTDLTRCPVIDKQSMPENIPADEHVKIETGIVKLGDLPVFEVNATSGKREVYGIYIGEIFSAGAECLDSVCRFELQSLSDSRRYACVGCASVN